MRSGIKQTKGMRSTEPGVFILESNRLLDERRDRWEGRALRDILRLLDRRVDYRYLRTKKELATLLEEFHQSRLRYLHLTCHGNSNSFGLTLDYVDAHEFVMLAAPYLEKKRLFISACEAAHENLARPLFAACKIYSIAGPAQEITYSDAAVAWALFYNLVFRTGATSLQRDDVEAALRNVCQALGLKFNAFFRRSKQPYYRKVVVRGRDAS